jgi:predicted ArsR family transcriptional regulator
MGAARWPPRVLFTTVLSVEILGPAPVRYDVGAGSLSAPRARILEQLQSSSGGTTVEALATRLGLHTNTVREHLGALVERGLARRELAAAVGRGRPAWSYASAAGQPEPDPRVRDYVGLASALAGQIARTSVDPEADALYAGEHWGRALSAGLSAKTTVGARRSVVALLTELGFAPESDARASSVRLRRCPLLDAARAHPEIICPVHLGIVRAALAALGADPEAATLVPFAEPGACSLNLTGTARSAR